MALEKRHRHQPVALSRAKGFRRESSKAELIIWSRLRNNQLEGFKFRRQHPIVPYIADFYCAQCALIIELDGESHNDREQYDEQRTKFIESQGYHVVRYTNFDAIDNTDGVLTNILQICRQRSSSPRGGRGWVRGERQ